MLSVGRPTVRFLHRRRHFLWFAVRSVVVDFDCASTSGTGRLPQVASHVECAEHVDKEAGIQREQGRDRFRVGARWLELHLQRVIEHDYELDLQGGGVGVLVRCDKSGKEEQGKGLTICITVR